MTLSPPPTSGIGPAACAPDTVYEYAADDTKSNSTDTDAFMNALQDLGEPNKNLVQEYKGLLKVVAPVQARLKAAYPNCGVPKNPTDARSAIFFGCVHICQHRDTAEVAEPLRNYAAIGSTKVYFVIGGGADGGRFGVVLW